MCHLSSKSLVRGVHIALVCYRALKARIEFSRYDDRRIDVSFYSESR
jgi:hypothetical protein